MCQRLSFPNIDLMYRTERKWSANATTSSVLFWVRALPVKKTDILGRLNLLLLFSREWALYSFISAKSFPDLKNLLKQPANFVQKKKAWQWIYSKAKIDNTRQQSLASSFKRVACAVECFFAGVSTFSFSGSLINLQRTKILLHREPLQDTLKKDYFHFTEYLNRFKQGY